MNWLQKVVILVWGVLVSLKFYNIPKYVELESVKMKVTSDTGFESMQKFNDYSSVIPSVVIYTVIALVLFFVLTNVSNNSVKNLFKNHYRNIITISIYTLLYLYIIIYEANKLNDFELFNYYFYTDYVLYSILYLIIIGFEFYFSYKKLTNKTVIVSSLILFTGILVVYLTYNKTKKVNYNDSKTVNLEKLKQEFSKEINTSKFSKERKSIDKYKKSHESRSEKVKRIVNEFKNNN